MLKFFTRMKRTRNFVLLLFSILMVASLVLFYSPTSRVEQSLRSSDETVAKVNGEYVTAGEIVRQQEQYSQFSQRSLPSKTLLDGLIRQRILRTEANRLGLRATDAEVAQAIRDQFKSDDGTPFDQTRYEENVSERFGTVANYEQAVRDDLSAAKVQAFITSGVTVAEQEIIDDYKRQNTKFDLTYVPVSVTDLAQTIKPTDEELKDYFEKNKATYYISSPQKKIRYIFLNTAKVGEKLNISDEELKAEYDKLEEGKKKAGVQGQEIVLRVSKPEFEQQVTQKANQLVTQLRKDNGKISEEAFAEIAKGQSENPNTARSGGKINGVIKENPNNPEDPYQKLLTMQPGEVTDPVNYKGNIYILRRGEDVPKTFEDAKKELEVSLRNRRAYTATAELAQKIDDRLKEVKDVQKVAAEFAPQANMSASEMIKETGFIKPGDTVEGIGVSPQFEDGIAPLENAGDVGEKTPIPNGFAIPALVEKRDPRDADFDEVKDQVAESVKLEKARNQVEEIAKQIASAASSVGDLSSAASAKNLKTQDQKAFILGSPLGQGPSAGTNEALQDAIFALNKGDVAKTPIKVGDNWYIVGVNNREEANMDDFAKQRDQLIESKLQQKRGTVFSDYLAETRARLEKDGKITIYNDVLAKIDAANEENKPDTPPTQPGLPPNIQQMIEQKQQQQQGQAPVPPPPVPQGK